MTALFVFPMLVGVFLRKRRYGFLVVRLPHAREGVSKYYQPEKRILQSSPCSWGCFCIADRLSVSVAGLPHARGGVSNGIRRLFWYMPSSPCSWGCFYCHSTSFWGAIVFPIFVGVFFYQSVMKGHMPNLPGKMGGNIGGFGGPDGMLPPGGGKKFPF